MKGSFFDVGRYSRIYLLEELRNQRVGAGVGGLGLGISLAPTWVAHALPNATCKNRMPKQKLELSFSVWGLGINSLEIKKETNPKRRLLQQLPTITL